MSGSSIQIFSLMMTGMALWTPLNAIASVNTTFARYDTPSSTSSRGSSTVGPSASDEQKVDLKIPKLIFLSLQFLALAIGLYKCSTMGLLPLTSADWTHYIPSYVYLEHAGAAAASGGVN
jgi:ER membrane protein complex subunit 4